MTFWGIPYEFLINILGVSYEHHMSSLQTSYKFLRASHYTTPERLASDKKSSLSDPLIKCFCVSKKARVFVRGMYFQDVLIFAIK
jgi:hypothetical protein